MAALCGFTVSSHSKENTAHGHTHGKQSPPRTYMELRAGPQAEFDQACWHIPVILALRK